MRKTCYCCILIAAIMSTFTLAASAEVPPGLKAGDTVAFYGDSITHGGRYVAQMSLFYCTRYPDVRLRMFNAGVGGNSTNTALHRFRHDVAEQKPALVAVLLGMNDGGYQPLNEKRFGVYKKNMITILDRIAKETKAGAVLLTPPMYDYQLRMSKRGKGKRTSEVYNQVLIQYGDFLKVLGKERGIKVIDLNAPMVACTAALRKSNPNATLSRDGVHPNTSGHFVITHAILKGFGVSGIVSSLSLDATTGKAEARRCRVLNLKADKNAVEFDLLQEALPFPRPAGLSALDDLIGFSKDLNREIVKVTGLNKGKYALSIDKVKVGQYTSEELAKGIDLAGNAATPQYKQALEVAKLNQELENEVKKERLLRLMEKKKGYLSLDGTYPSRKMKRVKGDDGKTKSVVDEAWEAKFAKAIKEYPEILKRISGIEDKMYSVNKPEQHHYSLLGMFGIEEPQPANKPGQRNHRLHKK